MEDEQELVCDLSNSHLQWPCVTCNLDFNDTIYIIKRQIARMHYDRAMVIQWQTNMKS